VAIRFGIGHGGPPYSDPVKVTQPYEYVSWDGVSGRLLEISVKDPYETVLVHGYQQPVSDATNTSYTSH